MLTALRPILQRLHWPAYQEHLFMSMPTGLFTFDRNGRITTFNAHAERLTGLSRASVRGQPYQRIFATNLPWMQRLETSWHSQTSLPVSSLEFLRTDGRRIPLALWTAPLRDHKQRVIGLVGIFEELTLLYTATHQLHRTNRLAALGQMAASVAHEIKNPLTSIRILAQLVAQKHHDPQFLEKFQRIVPHELDRINLLIEDLLYLGRPTRSPRTPVALPALFTHLLEVNSERLHQQHIIVNISGIDNIPAILGNAELLCRAFTNIVLNAIEAMTEGGTLDILCRPLTRLQLGTMPMHRKATPMTSLDAATTADQPLDAGVEILFEDTGPGIPPEQLEMIYMPFWTSKPLGTGLGLALTQKIIDEHHGTIALTSEVGRGTRVTVRLPQDRRSWESPV